MENMFKMGPTQMQGEIWDEKGFFQIAEILISHQQDSVKSIQFSYIIDERVVHSQIHGEPNGLKFDMVEFDYPNEEITSVSGVYKDGRLASITFGTDKKKYGPFGCTSGRSSESSYDEFEYKFNPGRFGGFHGSVYDGSVYAIGAYVKPIRIYTLDDFVESFCDRDDIL